MSSQQSQHVDTSGYVGLARKYERPTLYSVKIVSTNSAVVVIFIRRESR